MKFVIVLGFAMMVAGAASAETKKADDAHATRYAVVDKIPLPDGGWDYAMIDGGARRLYLGRDPGVMALDLDTKKITDVLVEGAGVHSALPVGDTGLVVSTNGDKNTATVFEAKTGKVKGSVPTGKMPDAAVYDAKTGLVAVMNHGGGTVTLVDPKTVTVVGSIKVGGELEFAVAPGDGTVFVNAASSDSIALLDIATKKKMRSMKLAGCKEPSGLAYDAADDMLIAVCANGVTKFVHGKDGADVATLKTGKGSDGVIYDAERRLTFVPSAAQGTLSVIAFDPAGMPDIAQTVSTQKGARLGALDPKTGKIYLPTAKMGPPVPPDPWPSVTPGTVQMWVVAPEK
jgi:DNA-binding beta-propeller fold protein YncE